MDELTNLCSKYIRDSVDCLKLLENQRAEIVKVITQLIKARDEGRSVYIIGNGGSASTASHMACDLNKTTIRGSGSRFRAVALTDNVPVITAWANDVSYDVIFKEQLANLVNPGDVLVAISGSGKSRNIIEAIRFARERGALTIGLTGFDGGPMKELVDTCIIIPSDSMYRIEDMHLMLNHLITYVFLSMKWGM